MKTWLQHPSVLVLLVVLGLAIACLLIVTAIILFVRAKKDSEEKAPEDAPQAAEPRVLSSQWQILGDSFQRAIRRLRDKTPGRDYQYSVPWYLLLGDSGTGKSLVAETLAGAQTEWVQSPGEESEPRWLLLEQAVLIDVPGAVLLSKANVDESGNSVLPSFLEKRPKNDETAWHRFLQLVMRYRPRQPLNGIVLTASATELIEAIKAPDHPARMARLAHLGRRLNEIQGRTGLSLPVYVLVTNCDALEGFSSYTQALIEHNLNRLAHRNGNPAELWDDIIGWSNPYSLERTYDAGWVEEAFRVTGEALLHRQLEILAACKSQQQAEGVLLFPFGVQELQEPLQVMLDLLFASTAYQTSHTLRGVYFCGRRMDSVANVVPPQSDGETVKAKAAELAWQRRSPMLFVRNLFEYKVFAEQFLAVAVRRRLFRGNRAVLAAQMVVGCLLLVIVIGFAHAWVRISHLQSNTLNPVLQSVGRSLQKLPAGSAANVRPATDLLNSAGQVENVGYASFAMPYSYLDTLRGELDKAVEGIIGRVLIGSCKRALENRVAAVMSPPVVPVVMAASTYPPGNSWKADPSYAALDRYLTDVRQLNTNIDRYGAISSAGFGTFGQLNALLRYLGGRGLPDTSRFTRDPHYRQLLENSTWDPISMTPAYDSSIAENTSKLIQSFYVSWFDSNPLKNEVDQLTSPDGLPILASSQSLPTNAQLRSLVSQVLSIDNQLNDGTFDWLVGGFNRESYPAIGNHLDGMAFANSQFTNAVEINGERELAGLQVHLQQSGVLTMADGRIRLDGKVRTLASVLNVLLQYDLMAHEVQAGPTCSFLPQATAWNQNELSNAIQVEASREKIENDLLPSLPENYRVQVKAVVDDRASSAIYADLKMAAASADDGIATEPGLEAALQNFDQSSEKLTKIDESLANLHASRDLACLNRVMVNQARALLARVNQEATGLYTHANSGDDGTGGVPTSEWLFGVSSPDELQSVLANERQNVVALSTQATPLVDLLRRRSRGASEVLARWQKISRDVEALQEKKPGNPIQTLEAFITNDVDKIAPQANCKAPAILNSNDEFLGVRSDLTRVAVERCQRLAVARFNQIASSFNGHLSGKFPFSQALDTRLGAEATPEDVASFYQMFDRNSDGLIGALANGSANPGQSAAFLKAMSQARPLVSGVGKIETAAVEVQVQFRTSRNREVLGNRIAEWTFTVGQKSVDSLTITSDTPPLLWQFGDPVTLSLRYAYDSPETPASPNPSPFAHVKDRTITYRYTDPWALLSFFQDHRSDLPGTSSQYEFRIPNQLATSGRDGAPPETTVFMQIDVMPPGAKEGASALSVPAFPATAPVATYRSGPKL